MKKKKEFPGGMLESSYVSDLPDDLQLEQEHKQEKEHTPTEEENQKNEGPFILNYDNMPKFPLRNPTIFDKSSIV